MREITCFDVTNGSAEQASALKKIGAIDPYQSPQRQFFNTPNKDKDGYFTSLYVIPIVLGYNTNLVKRPASKAMALGTAS